MRVSSKESTENTSQRPCYLTPYRSAGGANASLLQFNAYAASTSYAEPNSASAGPYQYAYSTDLNMFAYMQAHPPMGPQFNHHMGGYRQGRPSWMDEGFFPVQERLVKGMKSDADAALIVDVGGSIGHDLAEFAVKHPNAQGRLVLQDLPAVLGQIPEGLDGRIERMGYDFFTEQPVKGEWFSPSTMTTTTTRY
jgi:hypothetical protein